MTRPPNTRGDGSAFDPATVEAVWQKGTPVPGHPNLRRDDCGALIERSAFGETSGHGWEIDHVYPLVQGGGENLANLIPLHWQNNRKKGDDYPDFQCAIGSGQYLGRVLDP